MKQNKKFVYGISIVIIGIVFISIAGTLFLQNNLNKNYEKMFFTLQDDNTVSSFPSKDTWVAGEKMTYVSTIKNGFLVLATSSANDTVFAIDSKTGEIMTFQVGKTPKGVKIRPDGNFAFVANEGSDSVTVIDLVLRLIHKEIPIGKNPHNIIFHPTEDLAFVTLQGDNMVAVIDAKKFEIISLIPVEGFPHNLDISPDGKFLYVTNVATDDVAVINLENQQIIKRIPVSAGHHGIDVSPDGSRVYVSGIGDSVISIIDTQSLDVIKQINVGKGPHGIRTSSDGSLLYVALWKLIQRD